MRFKIDQNLMVKLYTVVYMHSFCVHWGTLQMGVFILWVFLSLYFLNVYAMYTLLFNFFIISEFQSSLEQPCMRLVNLINLIFAWMKMPMFIESKLSRIYDYTNINRQHDCNLLFWAAGI